MRRRFALLLVSLVVPLAVVGPSHAATLQPVGTFDSPIFLTSEPADGTRLYVVERPGRIRRVGAAGVFLDLSAHVSLGSERGLLSMAFAPDYATSGLLYVFHTDPGGDLTVAEYRRASAEAADPASRRVVLVVEHSAQANHNGGQLAFGPDGLLYVSTGDGGGGGDPMGSGQSLATRLGKLLRIDPRASATAPYGVPADNPFTGTAGAAPEIWAYGLRNPWRVSFDRATGDLVVADVGQNLWEEVDYVPRSAGGGRGANFGWNCFEGRNVFNALCSAPGHVPPVLQLSHGDGFCSITGGYVVRDPGVPELFGRYLYGDFCQDTLRSAALAVPDASGDRFEALSVPSLASFGEDACGRVYALSLTGPVYRVAGASPTPCGPGGAAAPGGPRPPGATPAAPATVRFLHPRTQNPFGRTRRLYARIRCRVACRLTVRARVSRAGIRSLRLNTVTRRLGAGRVTTIRWAIGPARSRHLRRMLASRRAVRLRVDATTVDAVIGRSTRRSAVRVRR